MLQRLLKDESGMAMALAVIMMVLIGVMGAGLLVFVQRDLGAVVENNQGQRALEMADAGVEAAKRQLTTPGGANPESYNGRTTEDLRWSRCFGLPSTASPPCSPPADAGVTLTNLDDDSATTDSVHVTIEYTGLVNGQDVFTVISTGTYGNARRKIEAVFQRSGAIAGIPAAYYTRNNLKVAGNMTATGLSFFAYKNADLGSNSIDLGTTTDVMKKWALTNDSDSYPNDYNFSPRASSLPGIAAQGIITTGSPGLRTQIAMGTRSYDSSMTYTGPRVVPYYSQSALNPSLKIAFPFYIDSLPNDLEVLRAEAIRQEAADGQDHYVNLASAPSKPYTIDSWPTNSTYNTIYFYRFASWDPSNDVQWNLSLPCTDDTRKGIIVVENGNFLLSGNKGGFNGTVLTYGGTDPLTGQPYPDRGQFKASGGACITGYATATGDMTLVGNYRAAAVPALTDLKISAGAIQEVSWRELYQ